MPYDPKQKKRLEDFIESLFKEGKPPFFDKREINPDLIAEFARDPRVQLMTLDFVSGLRQLWGSRFPGNAKPVSKAGVVTAPPIKNVEIYSLGPVQSSSSNMSAPILTGAQASLSADSATQSTVTGGFLATPPTNSENRVPPSTPAVVPASKVNSPGAIVPSAVVSSTATLKPGHVPAIPSKPLAVLKAEPVFHLPNCKVGIPYSEKIEGVDKSGRSVSVVDLRFPDGFGLTFDVVTQMVTGQPLVDGEFDIDLQWTFVDAPGKASGTCKLTANPDPKSLWKVIEPAADLPYRKAHFDQKLLKGKGFSIAAASRRGRSHEHGGSFRDDDFFISDDPETGWSVLIVADGAGSAKSSREGSRIAVATAGKFLIDSLAGEFGAKISRHLAVWDADAASQTTIGTDFHYFFHKMAGAAIQAIEHEAQAQNAPVKEYSTTLLAAAVKKDGANTFLATFWMGDGAIAAYGPRGTVKLMGTPDGGEFAGQTRFLDRHALVDQGFGKRVRVGRLQNISSVILMTDGVSDPYFETDNGLADPAKWDALWADIQPQLSDTAPEQRLLEWLHFFKPGHHDDRTIALLW